jgi:predicted secreted Zn-dependent protease
VVGFSPELRAGGLSRTGILILIAVASAPCASVVQPVAAQSSAEMLEGPHVALRYEYYRVKGDNAESVMKSLHERGPTARGKTYFGLTTSETGFSFQLVPSESGCRIASLGVHTEIVVTLPKWDPPRQTPAVLTKQWELFLDQLTRHELWHAQASRDGTDEMWAAVTGMTGASCRQLDRKAKAEIERISKVVEQKNEDYDRATDHGRRDGIVWRY